MPLGIMFSIQDEKEKQIIKMFCSHAKNNRVADMVKMLQEHPGFNVDTPFTNGFTALHYACKHNALDTALFLLTIGADLKMPAKDKHGTTPLDLCTNDDFKQKMLDASNIDLFTKMVHMSTERRDRFQLGDLYYETILQNAYNSRDDEVFSMLYLVTGNKFDILIRKVGDNHVYDALFNSNGQIVDALIRVGIPHEHVNSRYLIATDVKSDENVAKLKEFYFNPLNKYYIYCEDELKANRLKDNEPVGCVMSFDIPEFIQKKYFTFAPSSANYFLERKNDPESQLYFERVHRKLEPIDDYNNKYEQLAAKARTSLLKTFSSSSFTSDFKEVNKKEYVRFKPY